MGFRAWPVAAAGRYLATAWIDHTIWIYDARTLLELGVIQDPTVVIGVIFTSDSRDVLSWDRASMVHEWDACTDCESARGLLALAQVRVTRVLTAQERRTFGVR